MYKFSYFDFSAVTRHHVCLAQLFRPITSEISELASDGNVPLWAGLEVSGLEGKAETGKSRIGAGTCLWAQEIKGPFVPQGSLSFGPHNRLIPLRPDRACSKAPGCGVFMPTSGLTGVLGFQYPESK